MKAVIIEDELPAYQELCRLLGEVAPQVDVVEHLTSIEDAVHWFSKKPAIDLVFMDIQLSDGLSFRIFEEIETDAPVIFTTAYDQYALQAFQVRGVDYLLKPIEAQELKASIGRVEERMTRISRADLSRLSEAVQRLKPCYKTRFAIRVGANIKLIDISQVSHFEVEGNYVTLYDMVAKKYVVDYRMEELAHLLSPGDFFRISRQHIVHVKAIREVESYPGGRYAIKLNTQTARPVVVSASRAREFRQWLEEQ